VGESHYQDALDAICGGRTSEGADFFTEAELVLEDDNRHDDQAVRVEIDQRLVGYLSRGNARRYRRLLVELGLGRVIGVCDAWIRGGWDRGRDDRGNYGVLVGVPLPGHVKQSTRRRTSSRRAKSVPDAHGQPPAGIHADHRARRSMDELIGFCKGIIMDGVVQETEVTAIAEWLKHHPDVHTTWPADVVAARVQRILGDGVITSDERDDLRQLLEQVTGSDAETAGK
jgi:hypothetical protein